MKFLCVPCDSPMKLQAVGPPERGSLSIVYSCPECGYEMAMLTNAYETQAVQSLGVRIGPEGDSKASGASDGKCPFAAMIPGTEDARSGQVADPLPVRWTAAAVAPECLTILTGGEPLLRRDILEIVRRAAERGLWVVVGTNGVCITENVARRLAEAGARGLSLSLDALDPDRHDRFRMVRGAWQNTVDGAQILNRTGLPFIVQTTAGAHNLGELDAIADFAHDRLAAKVWNLYFLVPTGRGQFVSDMTAAQYDEVLASLYRIQRKYDRRMLVNAKCAPHYIKTVLENSGDETDPKFRTYSEGAGGCPAGTHYMGIRPNGDVTPCPYLPVFAGNLRRAALTELWTSSELFTGIRRRASLGGRCGACEMNAHCGGCRARAYGMTGDLMAEDPLCTHTPGKFVGSPLLTLSGSKGAIKYGSETPATIAWDETANERMKKIPAFVRGMVVRAVE